MTERLTVRADAHRPLPQVNRSHARDGWRVFRSRRDGYEFALTEYQARRVERIAQQDRKEWHAIVVGEIDEDKQGVHSVARDFVPNDWAERGPAHVNVSAMAEGHVRELAVRLHPKLVPLGIIHTHPGYGTSPSGTDRAEFWSDPHAISVIVDPTDRPSMAVYRGPEGERLVEHTTPSSESATPEPTIEPRLPVLTPVASMLASPQPSAKVNSKGIWFSVVASVAVFLLSLGIRSDVARTQVALRKLATGIAMLESRLDAAPRRPLSQPPFMAPASVPDGPHAICSDDSTSW